MIRFKIYKNPSGVWLHQQIATNGELYKPFILGKFAVKFDGDFMKINEEGGSRRFYDDPNNVGMRYDEVQVFVNGVGETFGSVQQLAARLRDLYYPGFDYVASSGGLDLVTTQNSETVTFIGNGTPDNPLMATAIGGGGSVPNGFVTLNPIIEDGNQRTFQAGETYNLAGELRTLAADYATTIATESDGVSRFDVVYALANGTYGKAVGTAGEVAQIPDIPSGSLMRAIFAVNGSAINEQPPIVGSQYVTKNSFNLISVTLNGLQMLLYGGTYVAQPGVTFISGFASPSAATTFYGQPIKIFNNTGGEVVLRHGEEMIQMDFVSGEDYTMQDQETATFWLEKDSNKLRLQSSSVRGGGASIDQDNQFKRHTFTLADLGVSSFEEVTDAMLLAAAQNAGIPVSDIQLYIFNVIEGNEPVEYNFDVTADWAAMGVTDEASFLAWDGSPEETTVSNFNLVGNRLQVVLSLGEFYPPYQSFNFINLTDIHAYKYFDPSRDLDLNTTNLTILREGAFYQAPFEAFTANFSNCQISVVEQLPNVTEINLNHNNINSLDAIIFPPALRRMSASFNNLTSIDGMYADYLEGLAVSVNQIERIDSFVIPSNMSLLNISVNPMDTAAVNAFLQEQIYYYAGLGCEIVMSPEMGTPDPALLTQLEAIGITVTIA